MQWGSEWLISRIRPREEAVVVSENVKGKIGKARQMSGVAVRVSAALVSSVIAVTTQLADTIADEVRATPAGKKIDEVVRGNELREKVGRMWGPPIFLLFFFFFFFFFFFSLFVCSLLTTHTHTH
jgi:hypothetical protein